jgi:hypothetical protein
MAKTMVSQIPAKLYELLEPLTAEERTRVVQATLILFGDEVSAPDLGHKLGDDGRTIKKPSNLSSPSDFFQLKDPKNKGEILAVAARYRESKGEEKHSKSDLKDVIVEAGRNFDDTNFARDMNNAKRQAGFFNLGTGRDARLSYYGKQYIDALPDRAKAGALKKPKVGGRRSRPKKKAAKKP